ncbi:hypothetical protein IAT38_003138 [Cryptococcus sp. DSM 104549]
MANALRLPSDGYVAGPRDQNQFLASTTSLCSINSADLFYQKSRPNSPLDAHTSSFTHRDHHRGDMANMVEVILDGTPSTSPPPPSNPQVSLAPSITSPRPFSPSSSDPSSPASISRTGSMSYRRKPVPPISIAFPDDDFGSGVSLPANHPFANPANPSPVESASSSREDVRLGRSDLSRSESQRGGGPGIERRASPLSAAGRTPAPVPPFRSASAASSANHSRVASPVPRNLSDGERGARAEWLRDVPGSGARTPSPAARGSEGAGVVEGVPLDGVNKQLKALAVGGSPDKPLPPVPTRRAPAPPVVAPVPQQASYRDGQNGTSHKSANSTASASSVPVVTPRTSNHDPRIATWGLASGGQGGLNAPVASALARASSSSRDPPTLTGIDGITSKGKGIEGEKTRKVIKGNKIKPLYPGEPEVDRAFDVDRIPSKPRLLEAASRFVRDEEGELVSFSDFFPSSGPSPSGAPAQKTVVFFIRSFWCGQCQDYTLASISILSPEAVEKAGIRVVIIGQGNWKTIKPYRKLFGCPFAMYVDPERKLYPHMGMTRLSTSWGPTWFNGRAEYHQKSVPMQIFSGAANAVVKMHQYNPGSISQLGGEFILTPGINCEFAHRMTHASDHMEAPDVLRIAGCASPTAAEVREIELADAQKEELAALEREMKAWRSGRAAELERMRAKKAARRGQSYVAPEEKEQEVGDAVADSQRASPSLTPNSDTTHTPTPATLAQSAAAKRLPQSFLVSHPSDIHKSPAQLESEWDSRFEDVMREEEAKAKERAAAEMLATCLVVPPEQVGEELGEEVEGEVIIESQRGLVV